MSTTTNDEITKLRAALSKLARCSHGCVHACLHTRHFEKVVDGLGITFDHVPEIYEDPAQAKLGLD